MIIEDPGIAALAGIDPGVATLIGLLAAVAAGFYLGQRRTRAALDLIDSFRAQARITAEAGEDGEYSDTDCRRIAMATREFFDRLEDVKIIFLSDLVLRKR